VFYGVTCTRAWTMSTPPLAGQKPAHPSPGSQEGVIEDKKISQKLPQVMSSPQPHGMNRYTTNHAHHR
jgi:hypothetical protein